MQARQIPELRMDHRAHRNNSRASGNGSGGHVFHVQRGIPDDGNGRRWRS